MQNNHYMTDLKDMAHYIVSFYFPLDKIGYFEDIFPLQPISWLPQRNQT